jgi:DNA-binding NtrC family response regulator
MRVLIIEDDAKLNEQSCKYLTENGYDTIPAKGEEEAEEILKAQGNDIGIAIVDMFLPAKSKDLDDKEAGLRLIQLMTEQYPLIVKIVFTGQGDLDNARKCMEAGAFTYCAKGGDPEELLCKLREAEERNKFALEKTKGIARGETLSCGIDALREEMKDTQNRLGNLMGSIERLIDEVQKDNISKAGK